MNDLSYWFIRKATRAIRRYLVGPEQRWVFERPSPDWVPSPIQSTSLYLHVPFCRHFCPYCPYTKFPYRPSLEGPFARAAVAELDWWAKAIGPAEITSIYIGGGTPTLALESVEKVLAHMRRKFHLVGDICIETNPADVDQRTVDRLKAMDVALISLGVESFQPERLDLLGRKYQPEVAERSLELLARSGFASVNADIMFALPGQTAVDLTSDLSKAAELGANQITTYPLFTFPYTSVGKYLRLRAVRMPNLATRRSHYQAISQWCADHGFQRVSVWGFKKGTAPRYSSVTRDGYIGIGPGSGSHLSDGFVLNTFDLKSWIKAANEGGRTAALRMPFTPEMAGWWWLYWRFYDTSIPLGGLDLMFDKDSARARRWLSLFERAGMAVRNGDHLDLTERGSFWLHLVQNYFALNYVNKLWTHSRQETWPLAVAI